jgi:hypothetical protein
MRATVIKRIAQIRENSLAPPLHGFSR